MKTRFQLALVVCALLVGVAGCSASSPAGSGSSPGPSRAAQASQPSTSQPASSSTPPVQAGAAAIVNGAAIPESALAERMTLAEKSSQRVLKPTDSKAKRLEVERKLLDTLIDEALVMQAAKDRGISVTDGQVKEQVAKLRSGFKSEAAFKAALKSEGMDLEVLAGQIRGQLTTQALVQSISTDTKNRPAVYESLVKGLRKRADITILVPELKAK